MSVSYSFTMTIHCDNDKCRNTGVAQAPYNRDDVFNASEAMGIINRSLLLQGWAVKGKKNLCPFCVRKKKNVR